MALGALGKWFTKNTGRVLGDIAGSAALAATNQLGSTYNNVIERYVGMNNENGGVTQDKNGDLKFNEGVSLGKAIKDGFGSATIENFSEMFGEYLPGAPKLLSKLGLSKVSSFFEKIGNNAYYKWLSNATNKSGIQGVMAEISEEEFGTALHAAWGDGDGSWSDFNVFTNPDAREKQIDTCLGMFYSVGFMQAPRTAVGAINAVRYFNIKHQVAKADKFGQMMFNDKWNEIKSKIDVTTNADLTKTVLDATRSDSMTAKQKGAVINYAMFLSKLRGFNQAADAKTKDKVEEGDTAPTLSNDLDDAYTEGHNADDTDKHNIQLEQNDKANELAAMLHITPEQLHDMADEDLEAMTGQDDKLDQAIYDYQVSTAKYQGVMDGAQDEVDMAAHQAAMETDNMTDLSRGTVRKATIKATGGLEDYEVYIISGNIATHDDGSIDVGNSDDMIIYYDPTTGRKEHADAMMFADLIEELPAADVKAQAINDAKENAVKKIAGIIDGTIEVGSQFSVTDADGTEHTYEVLADNGDGTAMITIDGNVPTELVKGENVQVPVSFEELQKMKDESDQQRLQAAKAEREQMEKERAEQQTQETEETQPSFDFKKILNDNGNVVLADVLDEDGNTRYPNSKLFLIRDSGAKAKVVELKSDGTLKSHAVNKKDVRTATTMTLDEYKQAFADSSMIEDNSGEESDEDSQLANLGLPKGSEIWMSGDGFGRPKESTLSRVVGIDEQGSIVLEDKDGKKWSASFDYINNHRELPPLDENANIVNEENNQSESNADENTPAPEQTLAITLEDGTEVPMLEDGNPDFSKLTAAQTAELYDSQFGEDADSVISGWVSDAKKALDKASNMTVKGKTFVEQRAAKDAKEKAIADAQAAYDSAIAIRDAYNERQLAKVEDTAEGRKELIEKARRKFARLKSAVKDDAEAVAQLYRDTIGSLLHRLYDGTGIDVTDTIPLTAEEYVASNLGAHSLNYEGTETSKGVKQETGLSREDFAKTQLLAADGKGTTIDNLVHNLWENRPSNLESLDTQDIRAALLDIINSGFKASEARNFVENIRIAQAENILEEQKRAQENAAYAEQQKAEPEAEQKAMSDEKAEPEAKSKAMLDNESDNESNDLSNETDNEKKNDNINDNINVPEDATDEKPLGEQRTKSPFLVRENGKQQTETESDADVEKNKVDDMKVVDNIVGKKTRKTLEKIAKVMGANIQWLYSNKQFNGRFDEKTNTIYLTLDSSIIEGVQFIFGHEMTHKMRTKNPAVYEELKTLVKDMKGEDAFNSETDKMQIRYKEGGARYWNDRNAIEEEVVADQLGIWIRDANYAHTLLLKMSHPLLARLHEIVNSFLMALHGTEFSDDMRLILRSIEQAYVKTAKGQVTNSESGEDVSFSLRQKPEPKKKGVGYKVFVLKDGKLYPPMVANPDGAATPVGVWLDADAAPIAGESKTGRPQVKQGGKGTQGGSGKLAYRPGWHLGVVPYAIQFNRKDAEGNKTLFPKNFVFAEVEYAADVDYQEEARQEGINPSGKYQHSLAGLKHLPTDGYYMYRTNPNPETDPWVITGAMKVNRILTRAEQADLVSKAGREPQQIQEGDIVTDDVVNSINQEIADAPKFSLKVYHGSGADFTEFDFDHMGEGAGSQVFGWGGYVTSSKKIGKDYAMLKDNPNSNLKSDAKEFLKSYPTYESFLANHKRIGASQRFTESEKKNFYEGMVKAANISRNLYEVDIPEDNGSNYLNWDAPITDELIDKVAKALPSLRSYDIKDLKKDRTFDNFYKTISMRSVKDDASFNDDKAASKLLSSLGYTGIKYKAGRNFGGAEEGDTNYVIFKPEDMKITEHTKFSLKDNQGNPLNQDGTLKLDKIKSVDELTDEDFTSAFRNVELPAIPKNVDAAIGANGKPVVIKKNIFEKNWNAHKFTPAESKKVLNDALYNTDLVGHTQPTKKPNHWVAIKLDDKSPITVLEVNDNKDNVEVVGWYTLDERNLGRIKRQAERNGGELIMLTPKDDKVESLSTPPLSSAAKIDNSSETTKENGEKVEVEAPKTFDEFLNHPSLKFSIKNEQQRKAAEDAYEYASKLRPNKSSQYALVDMSNPSNSPEYYEKKVLADRWRRFYNKAVHNELDDVYKDAWGNYKLFDLDRPFADQVNEVKGDVPNEFNAPDVVANKNADNESGAEYHEYKQDEPSSITYKDRYKAFKQREANREKTAGLRKERKETEDSYNSKSKERVEYNKQLMKEYMDEHGLSSENDIPYDVWDNLRSKSFEKYQDELDSLFNKYKDLDKQIKAVAEPRFSLKDEKIKSVAEKYGVNEDDVAMYANAVEKGSTAEAARARANIKRYLLQANEDKISSFKELMKYTVPVNEALKENFGDLDAMIEERRKQVEAQRNAMEAARKRAQEEEEKRQKHLDELSLIPTDELDKRYMDAIANNDESTAREMLDESARRKGYGDVDSDYQGQGAWAAPSNPQYESDEARRADIENSPDVNLEDIALGYNLQPDDYFDNPRVYMNNTAYGLESAHVIKNALDAIKNGEKDVKVKVYRAVPTSVKEGKLRNGDWVTPSKKYAEMHGDNRLEGKYRIIEDEVPANQLWWDGNDANEFGFDDGKEYRYKNAKNNRKLNDLITYDNKGNVIPPSKRFNSRKSDIRFSLKAEKEKIVADAKANGTYMTAPNGEKTKLDAEQWATVRTTNFKNWFGDWENDPENASKVVDENGEPMVVWHGRSAEFNTFEKKEGVRFIMGLEDKVKAEGFFFSPDKGLAEEFASNSSRHRGGKANVVPCFLNIRRPMDLTGEDYDRIYEDVTGWEYMVGMDTQDNLWGIMDEEGMADKIKEKGYDGAIFVEEVDDSYEPTKISYCALDANQIKSAENNNGDFSADNNDIRFSLKSMMEKPEGWKQANKKAIHIAEAIERDPKFSLKNLDGTLIKAGTYFSGGGLVEEGLKGIIDPVVAVEYDEKISGVYRNNFGQHIVTADVRDVDPKELVKQIDGEVEYFHASPVCKNYSQAKSNHAEVELDKETAASTAEFINAIKPKVVTIENVKGYKDSDAMKTITDALDANGYTWDADVYNAADYGGYTNRERLIVRAVRDGKLPAKPKKMAHKSGWYEAVADIIPTLTEKKNGVAPWMDVRLKADGIDWRNIDKPLYVMGSAYADGKIPHAFADELLPTLRTKSGDVIVMPDGKVYRALGRVLARVSGVSDDYKMPFSENLSHTIIGNGIPTQLTEHVIAPLLTGSDPKFSIRTYHGTGASFDKFDLSHALEGEGSESFGHGVYVTNSSKIGREYAQRAKNRKMEDLYKNMRYPDGVKGDIFKRRVFGEMVNDVATGGSVASAKEFAKKRVSADANDIQRTLENLKDREKGTEYEQNLKDRLAEYKEGLKWIDSLDEDYLTQGNANRYDVDIPDDNGSNYLDWEGTIPDSLDKQKVAEDAYKVVSDNQGFNDFKATPLNDFIAHTLKTYVNTTDVAGRVEKLKSDIKDVIENYVADDDVLALNEYLKDATPDDVLATIWYNDLVRDIKDADLGEYLYRKLSTYVGDNAASQILSDNGLVGIKYPAGMIHGGAKEGDYNYVIFDENNANIVGNTRFSLRYDKFEHDLNQWKKDNNLPKDAQRPTIPQRNAGESAVDFLRRVDEYRKQMALWKTAPTYEQHLLSDDTALGEFNRELQRGSVLKRIAFQDSMLAIRKAQEAIMKEVGVDRLNMAEDAYTAENRSHGKGKNEFEEYNNEFLQPLRKAYHQMKKILGDSYDNVRIYMMAKHGLERDAQMAFKKSLEADYEDVAQRSAAYKAYKGDMNRIINDSDLEFGRVDFTTWRQRDNALRAKYSPSYMDYRYDKNGIAYDYSGLSALFDGSDFEEAAYKLVRDIESSHVAEVQDLWNATNAATKKILRDGYKAGMMSKDTYQYVRDMYSHYIPLRGWDGTTADQVWDYIGGGKGAFNQTLKTANGRTSIADDPIAYIENMAESGILLNNKNWVKQHLMLLAQNHPTSLLTLSKAWYVKSTDANGNEEWIPATPQITSQMDSNQVKAAIDAFEKKMEQMAQTGDATQKRDGLNIAYPQTHSEEREHEVRVMKDGEEYVIYVNGDPQLAQAMNNTRAHRVREIQSGKLDRAAAWLGRKMAAAYTSLSPLFIPSNYFRDLTMTLASTAIREDAKYNYLLRKNLATSWNLGFMLRDYQNGKLRDKVNNGNATPKEQMFYDFMMNGGETGFVSSLDVEDLKKKFKNDLKDLDRWKANPVKVGHTIMDGIEFLNRAIEDSNRFAVYMTSIQYGRSIDEAVNDAKDVTLNFNRKGTGEYGWQMIRNLYLFINPAVQSLQTLGALVKHHPFKFTAVTASWLASGVLVPIVNAALMSLLGGDDDKDKYWQFTKWDRRNNLIMWVPYTHEYVKIPLAQEFRAFYGIGDMIASKMMGGELAEESWRQYAEDLLGQVVDMLPLDPTGYDGNIAVSLMPNAIRPVFELAFNVDFTGKPLFKETEYNKYDPNFTKAYVGTPDWLVRASKMVNSIGNDYPDVQQNSIDAFGDPRYNLNNPAVVDHVLSSYLGGAYTMGSQVLGVLTKSLNDSKEIKVADIPLVSKFVSNPDDRPVTKKQGDEFWNMKENHDRAANTLSKLKKQAKVDGDYSMLERFYGSEEYKQYKQDDVKVKKYEEDKKKERAEESGEEYRPHKLNAEDIYKAHATPKDDFEDLKLKQLYTKLNGFKTSYDLLVDTAPSQSDGYYNTNKVAIDAIDEISLDKQEISELKKGFLDDGKDAYNAEDMKQIRDLRKKILSVLEKANKVVVANRKAKAKK